jgi:hypothetical protein
LLSLAERTDRSDLRLAGCELAGVPLLELGRISEFEALIARLDREGERAHDRLSVAQAAQWSATLHLLRGNLGCAQADADRALALAAGAPNFSEGHAAQTYVIHRAEHGADDLVDLLREAVAATPDQTAWRSLLALTTAAKGQRAEAEHHYQLLAGRGFRDIGHGWTRVAALAFTAATAAILGDASGAGQLADLLEPFTGTLLVIASGTSCEGAVDRYLAHGALGAGDRQTAQRLSRAAAALERRVGLVLPHHPATGHRGVSPGMAL